MQRVLVRWLIDNSSVFAAAVLSALLTAILSGLFLVWFERRSERRSSHFIALKEQVLNPLLQHLDDYLIPMGSGVHPPLSVENVPVDVRRSITRPAYTWDPRLVPYTGQGDDWPVFGPKSSDVKLNQELLSDARTYHFVELIGQLDALRDEIDRYLARALAMATDIARELSEVTGLPRMTGRSEAELKEWVNPEGLAVYVLSWQLRATASTPFLGGDGSELQINGRQLARGRPDTIERVVRCVDALAQRDEPGAELKAMRDRLPERLNQLRRRLVVATLQSRLPGWCPLLRG